MQLASGAPSNLFFNVELNGNISFDPSLSNSLTLKNGVLTVLPKAERWVILPEGSSEEKQADFAQILAVHAALLNNGKVFFLAARNTSSIPRFNPSAIVGSTIPGFGIRQLAWWRECRHLSPQRLSTCTICFVVGTRSYPMGGCLSVAARVLTHPARAIITMSIIVAVAELRFSILSFQSKVVGFLQAKWSSLRQANLSPALVPTPMEALEAAGVGTQL
jgi:hypothetical protein